MSSNIYQPTNSKNWYFRATIDGRSYRHSLHTTSKRVAEKTARSRLKELKAEANRGELDHRFMTGWVEFYELLEQGAPAWSQETTKRYLTSLRQIGRVVTVWCEDEGMDLGELQAADITTALISEYVARRRQAAVKVATINRDLTAFRHLMKHMKNKGWIEGNPVTEFEKIGMKEVLPEIKIPSGEAIQALADRAPGTLKHFPAFLEATGARTKEASMLRTEDVKGLENPVEGNVTVMFRKGKGRKTRTIQLRQEAIDILLQIPSSNHSPYVFWNSTEHGHYMDASSLFWDYGQETRYGHRLHDLRHKFAIERLRDGWSVYRVQRYLGHGSVTTTERYYFRYLTQQEQDACRADGARGL